MKILLALALTLAAAHAQAQSQDVYDSARTVMKSSVTVQLVLVSTGPTLVDIVEMPGSFIAEIQNRDPSNAICCGFDSAFATQVAAGSGKACRQIAANGGTWVVARWWQNLKIWCATFGANSTTSPVVITQGR